MSWLVRPSLLLRRGATKRLFTTPRNPRVQPLLQSHWLRFTSTTAQNSEQHTSTQEIKEPNHSSIQTPQSQSQFPDSTPSQPTTAIDADNLIKTHPTYQTLTQNPCYTLSRPHLQIPASLKQNHLVSGTLSGPGKITTPTYVFTSSSLKRVVTLFHAGVQVSGHPGFMQGGLMAVMFDEAFAKCVAMVVPSGVGMTVNISVDFRSPARLDKVFVLETWVVKAEGRKAWVAGIMKGLDGDGGETLVSESKALFVEPKFAASMVPLYRD